MLRQIYDWDDAYSVGAYIPDGGRYAETWASEAEAFRARMSAAGRAELDIIYGPRPRNRYDIFHPEGAARGLAVFIHGGYWLSFDKNSWSHLAGGPLARGFAVAIPSYTLCPEIRIGDIGAEVGAAVAAAMKRIAGPVAIAGHSAGGHLAARLAAAPSPLGPDELGRLSSVVPISPLGDLRPLMRTAMNARLGIDEAEAIRESPALLRPASKARITCWVGGAERAEFRRQSALLANIWIGLGAATQGVEEPDRHHFNVIDGLADPNHPLTGALVGASSEP